MSNTNKVDSHSPEKADVQKYQVGGWKAHWILIVCSLLYVVNWMDRTVFTVVVQPLKLDLGLTDGEVGLLLTIFTLSISVFSFPIAFLVDRWSRKKTMSIMAIIWSGFTYVTGMATNFIGVLIPRSLVGVGEAGYSAGGTAMITAAYPKEKHGKVLGVFNLFMVVGAAIGTIVGGIISVKMGWRAPFLIFAIPGVILGIAALFLKDYKTIKTDEAGNKIGIGKSLRDLLSIKTLRWYFIGYAMLLVMNQAILSWTPAYLMRAMSIKEDAAGMIVGLITMVTMVGAPLGGLLSDWWYKKSPAGRLHLPAMGALVAAFLYAAGLLTIVISSPAGIALLISAGLLYAIGLPALGAVSQEVIPPAYKGLSWGLTIFFMYFLGGAWSPWLAGGLSDWLGGGEFGLRIALIISCAGGILAALFFFISSKSYVADADKVKGVALVAEK